ncbi:MAG: hypothetical protein EHM41_02590 [Chloroflexi bacterium]|nr:MAG: hypothetical protein EHM41_02590 [Chloroflexota bacterium]
MKVPGIKQTTQGRNGRHRWLILAVSITAMLVILTGCQSEPPAPVQTTPEIQYVNVEVEVVVTATSVPPTPTPESTPPPDQSEYHTAWENGVHGSTYGLGKGPNTYCSRCHSPQNWDPESTTDASPNCVTCKFPQDPEVRQATTMAFVAEEDWAGISCETCHIMEDGIATDVAWLNALTGEYEEVATSNELCAKCHADTQGVQASGGRGVTHAISLGGSAHLNWAGALPQAHRPSLCTDCHNPMSGEAMGCSDCHTDVLTSDEHMKGMNALHTNVTCQACHDASGADVGPDPAVEDGSGMWMPVLTEVSRSGALTSTAIVSHSVKWEVACDRCHFAENPWELTVLTATGEVPEEE